MTRDYRRVSPKEIPEKAGFQTPDEHRKARKRQTAYAQMCCVRTDRADGDDLEFRYCSKCDGNYEYCQDHLFTHQHVHKKQ